MGNLGLLGVLLLCAGCVAVPPPLEEQNVNHPAPLLAGPHQTIELLAGSLSIAQAQWTSPWHHSALPFDELLPSWNVTSPGAFRVEVQVQGPELESPWLDLGGWGAWPVAELAPTKFAAGKVAIDILELSQPATQARVRLRATDATQLDRLTLCFTDSARLGEHAFGGKQRTVPRLAVPGRRQTDEAPELAPRICSPTSVSMLLEYRGASQPTAKVAAELFDVEHDIYGNWNRAVQGAARFGVAGYLTRINDWNEVASLLCAGNPLVISIGVKPGQLSGAPYTSTNGHLIVIAGLNGHGQADVLDPAVAPGESCSRFYSLNELDEVWLRRGGTAYVLGDKSQPGVQ